MDKTIISRKVAKIKESQNVSFFLSIILSPLDNIGRVIVRVIKCGLRHDVVEEGGCFTDTNMY